MRDALISVGEVMEPAIVAVVENHISQRNPIVVEGDGILPSLLNAPQMRRHVESGALRMVVLAESSEDSLLSNMRERNRGFQNRSDEGIATEARAKWLFSEWLTTEAIPQYLPIVASRPWETIVDRVLAGANDRT